MAQYVPTTRAVLATLASRLVAKTAGWAIPLDFTRIGVGRQLLVSVDSAPRVVFVYAREQYAKPVKQPNQPSLWLTQTGTGAGTIALSGVPASSFHALVKVSAGGLPAVATYQVSLDEGQTYGSPTPCTTNFLENGVTGVFSGLFVAGDVYDVAGFAAVRSLRTVVEVLQAHLFGGPADPPDAVAGAAPPTTAQNLDYGYDQCEALRTYLIQALHETCTANWEVVGGVWDPVEYETRGACLAVTFVLRKPSVDVDWDEVEVTGIDATFELDVPGQPGYDNVPGIDLPP